VDPSVLLFAIVIALVYMLVLAPNRNRKQRELDIKEHLKPGVDVMTTSGILAKVHAVTEEEMHLEVAPGVVVRLHHTALRKILIPELEARDARGRNRRKAAPAKPDKPEDGPGGAQDGEPPAPNTI
jgi:preprotein translocase subunit YajC